MKISTRILITLVLSLAIFGSTIIGISYVNTLKNEKMFLEEYQKSSYAFYENELKTILSIAHPSHKQRYSHFYHQKSVIHQTYLR